MLIHSAKTAQAKILRDQWQFLGTSLSIERPAILSRMQAKPAIGKAAA